MADFGLSVMLPAQRTHVSNLRMGTMFYICPRVILKVGRAGWGPGRTGQCRRAFWVGGGRARWGVSKYVAREQTGLVGASTKDECEFTAVEQLCEDCAYMSVVQNWLVPTVQTYGRPICHWSLLCPGHDLRCAPPPTLPPGFCLQAQVAASADSEYRGVQLRRAGLWVWRRGDGKAKQACYGAASRGLVGLA